jgi:hypothetical protein
MYIETPVKYDETIGVLRRKGEIALPHRPVKSQRFLFETFFPRPFRSLNPCQRPFQSNLRRAVKENGHVRGNLACRKSVQCADQVPVKGSAVPLVGQGSIGEAVADNDFSLGDGRPDYFRYMLRPCGRIEKKLGQGDQGMVVRVQQDCPYLVRNGTSAGFPCNEYGFALFFEHPGEEPYLGRFSAPLDPFECNKTGHCPLSIAVVPPLVT